MMAPLLGVLCGLGVFLIWWSAWEQAPAVTRERKPKRLETRTIDMHIANLREKLRDNADEPRVLLTVRGKGYMIAT